MLIKTGVKGVPTVNFRMLCTTLEEKITGSRFQFHGERRLKGS